jgi:hypothetical protein
VKDKKKNKKASICEKTEAGDWYYWRISLMAFSIEAVIEKRKIKIPIAE